MLKEEKTILEGILEEQKKLRSSVEDIQSDLMEYEKDHLLVIKLKSEVSGLRDDVDKLIVVIHKNQEKMDVNIQSAVNKGVQPATEMAQEVAEGLKSGAIPISKDTANGIKNSNFITKFIKKWEKFDWLGREKKGTRG
jgi:hypothetical protein